MFGRRITLFKLLGFEVGVDFSWVVLALLITWSLAVGYFPTRVPDLTPGTYWWMGVVGAIGLFFSIIFHEFSHSLVARGYGMSISGITLFLFGGVAQMTGEPKNARAEFLMAAAGPVASFVLGGTFYLIHLVVTGPAAPVEVDTVVVYLAWINFILGAFNLVPAFPLDGGRMLRAALWGWKGDIRWASRIASSAGAGFGLALILLGVISVLEGNFVGGMWWFLIGLFIRGAASSSYQQTVVRRTLQGVTIAQVMNDRPVTVSADASIADLIENDFHRYYYKMFPVLDGDRLVGCVTLKGTRTIRPEEWRTTPVREVMERCGSGNTLPPDAAVETVLETMQKSGNSRYLVAEGDRLLGIVTLKDLLRFLEFKLEEQGEMAPQRLGPTPHHPR
ncbi:MAG: site-2 protease family protein [Rhodospirillaceae bacterium]|nr:site-2 protease family protein [Rhodospirillaceae bacterium]|tara:strand:+ start:179 stop:1351 length:1173 start_codon:yes stop_codon:yes gene_type:complete